MAFLGIFGNYDKPGPGVSKDEPKKAAPVRFFEIFARKFTKLVQVNLIFAIPVTVALVLMFLIFMALSAAFGGYIPPKYFLMYIVPLPIIIVAPFQAGITYVTRNFVREEHAFVWSDFWTSVKNNWKLFLLNGLLTYVAYMLLSFAITYYYSETASQPFFYVPLFLCLFVSVILVFAQYYLPVMFITFDLKFFQAYKNALIFSIAGLFRNVFLTVIFGAFLFVFINFVPLLYAIMILLALYVLLLFSLPSYLVNFTVYPLIEKYLIVPYQKKLEEEKNGGEQKEVAEEFSGLFAPDVLEEEEEEDKYVYVNGRLIKKSELKKREE